MIFLKDVDASEMDYLLQFIYLGEVSIPSNELHRLVEIAGDLGIVGLYMPNSDEEIKEQKRKRKKSNSFTFTPKEQKVKSEHYEFLDDDFDNYINYDKYDEEEAANDSGHWDTVEREEVTAESENTITDINFQPKKRQKIQQDCGQEEPMVNDDLNDNEDEKTTETLFALKMKGNKRSSKIFMIGDHAFVNQSTIKDRMYMRCFESLTQSCKARAVVKSDTLEVLSQTHRHICQEDHVESSRLKMTEPTSPTFAVELAGNQTPNMTTQRVKSSDSQTTL